MGIGMRQGLLALMLGTQVLGAVMISIGVARARSTTALVMLTMGGLTVFSSGLGLLAIAVGLGWI